MNNKELAHKWAHQTNTRGTGSSFFYEGPVIFSYGHHFPVARIVMPKKGQPFVLFTSRGYSRTTARHKSLALSACSYMPVYFVSDVIGQKTDARTVRRLAADEAKRQADNAAAIEASQKRREAKAAKLLAKSPEVIAEWRAGVRRDLPHSLNLPVMLRAIMAPGESGDEPDGMVMETSKGARVPLADARRTYRFAMLARAKGWHRNGETHQIGSYQLDSVNEQGVIAGCHRVTWAEIEAFAALMGWTT
jgi:hypothetical protein